MLDTPPAPEENPPIAHSLSRREHGLIATWERSGCVLVSLKDLEPEFGKRGAKLVAQALVRKGELIRVQRGRYIVRRLKDPAARALPDGLLELVASLQDQPHYLGGPWAWSHREQCPPTSVIDVFVAGNLRGRTIGSFEVRFHRVPEALLAYGIEVSEREKVALRLSDPERTFVDALDHPKLFNGLPELIRHADEELSSLRLERVVEYAVRGGTSATCRRLGLLLSNRFEPEELLCQLSSRVPWPDPTPILLNPAGLRRGRTQYPWYVIDNVS